MVFKKDGDMEKSKQEENQSAHVLFDIIRRYYRTNYVNLKRLLYETTFPISESFVNLALVKEAEQKQKEAEQKRLEFRDERINSFEDIYKPKESIELTDIFEQQQNLNAPNHILVEGPAGIGKTTLCQYIANQWAVENGKLKIWRDKFKLLIWLPLRELVADKTLNFDELNLAALIHTKFLKRKERKQYSIQSIQAELDELIKNQELLLLLDGYDEIVPSLTIDSAFKEFFEQELLDCSNWILTSRPFYASNIKVDCRLENIGFTSENIPSYVQQFFNDIAEKTKAESLLNLFKANQNIHGIAHIPINLELICGIWEQEEKNLGTNLSITVLYDKLVLNLFKRYLHKFHGRGLDPLSWEDLLTNKKRDSQSMLEFLEAIAW